MVEKKKRGFPSQTAKGQEIQVLSGDLHGNCLCFYTKTFSPASPKTEEKLVGEKLTEETLLFLKSFIFC